MKKLVKVGFDIDLARRVMSKEIEGSFCTFVTEKPVDVVRLDIKDPEGKTILAITTDDLGNSKVRSYYPNGKLEKLGNTLFDLGIFVSEEDIKLCCGNIVRITLKSSTTVSCSTVDYIGIVSKLVPGKGLYTFCGGFINSNTGKVISGGNFGVIDSEKYPVCKEEDIVEVKVLSEQKEIDQVFQELTKYNYYWDSINNKIINKNLPFTTGDKVLGVDGSGNWRFDFFSHMSSGGYVCTGRTYKNIIKFTENSEILLREQEKEE